MWTGSTGLKDRTDGICELKIDFGPSYHVNPSLATVLKVARALGVRLHAEAA